jgi:hypothetical protein
LSAEPDEGAIEAAILSLVAARGPERTVCPSEVARSLAAEEARWRALMPAIRRVAGRLRRAGRLRISQRGREIDPEQARGPIRLSQA